MNKSSSFIVFSPCGGAPSLLLGSLLMWMHDQVPIGSRIVGKMWSRGGSQQFESLKFFKNSISMKELQP